VGRNPEEWRLDGNNNETALPKRRLGMSIFVTEVKRYTFSDVFFIVFQASRFRRYFIGGLSHTSFINMTADPQLNNGQITMSANPCFSRFPRHLP